MTDVSEGIDLDGLRALAEKATPGPWEADGNEVSQHWSRPEPWKTVASSEVACMSYCYGGSGRGIENEADAEFIAAANPSTVLALLARVREAEARVNRVVRLRDLMQKERDDVDVSVRLSTMIRDLNAALAGGDER